MSINRAAMLLSAVALAVGACAGGATPVPSTASPAPSSGAPTAAPASVPPAPTPVVTPGPTPSATGIVIRATTTQALSPEYTFAWIPSVVVTADGRVITPGAQIKSYPSPLLPSIQEQAITPAGIEKLVAAARAAGLLAGNGDFAGGAAMPGAPLGQLTIVADGKTYNLSGPTGIDLACAASQPGCSMPEPGTAAAFGWFWGGLADLAGWLGADLGAAAPYVASGYAILVGPPPVDTLPGNPIGVWPLKETPLASVGSAWVISGLRCATVTGDAAAQLGPVLTKANQMTAWVDDLAQSATRSVIVRPLLPGDGDLCNPGQ